ncbi:glycosyltransferase [Pedobacter sp. 22163]|uniref:glycosyltransferase n=1 Tax=Pedobacter sp. 22163 TaxID=3453883 RepID=UPI003F87283E
MTPKIIHHIVGPSKTEVIIDCIQSWSILKQHGFKIAIWDDDGLKTFIQNYFPFALQAFLTARNHAEASDIARYLIIYKYGGYYVDWDIKLFNIGGFIDLCNSTPLGYLLIDKSNGTLASEHFSAPKKEKYLMFLVKDIIHTFQRDERDLMATPQYSGPYRMRSAFRRYQESQQEVLDVKDVFEYDYSEIRKAEVYGKKNIMVHFWAHSWIK